MALPKTRLFFWLLVSSVFIVVFILSWGDYSRNISLAAFSVTNRSEETSHFWDLIRNSTPLSVVFNLTRAAKTADSEKTNPVTKLKVDQMRSSTHAAVAETPMPILFKKSFRKAPLWDFDDVYNQDAPPRPWTCAESLRNSEDESFKKAFLPNIRVFLHKDNINMSEWNRLSHFNNPFGFMQFPYDEVMSAVKLIPKPKEPLLLPKPGSGECVRCAVVGTGGILNGSRMGKEIDAHDYVFRMNGAVTEGYEEDVGNRTSVYVHTAHSISASPYFFSKYGYKAAPHDEGIKYVMIPEGMRDYNWLGGLLRGEIIANGSYKNRRPRTYYSGQYDESRFYVLHQDFLRYVKNRFLKSRSLNSSHWAIVRPTNGAFTLFLALQTCDTVSAYGFITEDYKKYNNYYFQRNIKTHIVFYSNHDYILEMKMWKKLHDSKILWLYQGPDSGKGTEKPK
uniref:alpha-N-acetylgalactosaminide alpha-2,6-sialyltransferase 2-like isoform X1 n=1 Tax=Epinephelus lanceolatus TaxID=310571 RepID=UPI001446B670|nr:alpha-N-acetylgalactosaminide alpha-2,6-sialyltransferase 2-like isoform X1 [Epinephelus lanceolatus]XP_033467590.1 alpha-N-acetylgalactosaminide alpha-2,6-sialyltransferase 2-like isoform X1 [Epinephelus lanceolatus]